MSYSKDVCGDGEHCVKSVRIFGVFLVRTFSPFGLNSDQKNSEYGHFSLSGRHGWTHDFAFERVDFFILINWL